MTPQEITDRIELCKRIAADVRNDAKAFDGKPFTGKTVGEYFGFQGAAIVALTETMEEILEHLKP